MEKEKYQAQKNYKKKNIKQLNIGLNRNTDKDIIDFLEKLDNKEKFIKKIIRANM